MRYSINFRLKNSGQHLVLSEQRQQLNVALNLLDAWSDLANEHEFVELVDNSTNQIIATYNLIVGVA
jgi:hypothetical protein